MDEVFLAVVIAVGVVGVVGALVALFSGRRTWEGYGRDGLLLDSDLRGAPASAGRPPPPSAATLAERDAELRQMLAARNLHRRRRGEPELDVEVELVRLTRPGAASEACATADQAIDAELRDEIRALVVARNRRRARRGEPELDVEAEIARESDGLGR